MIASADPFIFHPSSRYHILLLLQNIIACGLSGAFVHPGLKEGRKEIEFQGGCGSVSEHIVPIGAIRLAVCEFGSRVFVVN
jgi:hypothetical protein